MFRGLEHKMYKKRLREQTLSVWKREDEKELFSAGAV